jgi:hypothetical protein
MKTMNVTGNIHVNTQTAAPTISPDRGQQLGVRSIHVPAGRWG